MPSETDDAERLMDADVAELEAAVTAEALAVGIDS